MKLAISPPQLVSIERSALASMPEECCGLLIGRSVGDDHRVEEVRATRNVSEGDRTRTYEIAHEVAFDAMRDSPGSEIGVIGFYHSHPNGSRSPSAHDLRTAWPDKSYVIVSLRNHHVVSIRSWRLDPTGSRMVEESIQLTAPTSVR